MASSVSFSDTVEVHSIEKIDYNPSNDIVDISPKKEEKKDKRKNEEEKEKKRDRERRQITKKKKKGNQGVLAAQDDEAGDTQRCCDMLANTPRFSASALSASALHSSLCVFQCAC